MLSHVQTSLSKISGKSPNLLIPYFGFRCHRMCLAAVRGNEEKLLSLTHLSLILRKNASLSLSSMKSKNSAFFRLLSEGLFSCNASSLWLISPALDASASGFFCSAWLDVWSGSPVLLMVNFVAGMCFASNVSTTIGLLNQTLFLHRMGLLLVSWGERIPLNLPK